jgi:Uma2 family endonuclease
VISEIYVVYGRHEVFGHDVAGWRRDRMAVPPAEAITMRPDWVCEVLSPGHEKRDLVDKLGVLHEAGVPDYWVVDHEKKLLFMYRYSPSGYVTRAVGADAVIHAPPFDATELRVACILGDEDDEE